MGANWTRTGDQPASEWRRVDGVRVTHHASGGIRCWQAERGRTDYLRAELFAGSGIPGGVRTFKSAESAMQAADKSWPISGCTSAEDISFIARFVGRGWLAAERESDAERESISRAVRDGFLKRVSGEYHITKLGRAAIAKATTTGDA